MDWLSIRAIGRFRERGLFFGGEMFRAYTNGGNGRDQTQRPPMGDGTRWVKTPRASRLFERSGVQRFVGVDEP